MKQKTTKPIKTSASSAHRTKPIKARRTSSVKRVQKTPAKVVADKKKIPIRTKAQRKLAKPTKRKSHYSVHALKQLFIPNKTNQYRPHLIRRYGLTVILLLVIGVQAGYNLSTTGSVLGSQANIGASELLADTNRHRAENNLTPLQINEKLSRAATEKAKDMFAKQYWAHTAPDGTTPWTWFKKMGYDYSYAGENLAKNFTTSDSATTAWMASADHRSNILDEHYSDVGFATLEGELEGKPARLTVALYGKPKEATDTVAVASARKHSSKSVAIATETASGTGAAVQGATDTPAGYGISPVTRFGMAVQALTPAALGSLMLIFITATVAFIAHLYRKKLPLSLQRSWYRHHGMIKLGGMVLLCLVVILLYSGGQI